MRVWADDEKLDYSGRIDWSNPKEPVFVFPCTSVKMNFTGQKLIVFLKNHNAYWDNYIGCILDGKQQKFLLSKEGTTALEIPVEDNIGEIHQILLFKRQDSCHEVTFMGFEIGENESVLKIEEKPVRKIEVYGDSVSAGEVSEAVEFTGKEDPSHNGEYSNSWYSYAWMTARKLNAEIHDIAQGGVALMDRTGWFYEPEAIGMESVWDKIHYNPVFGKATTWNFEKYIPQLVIVAIGQNDSHPEDYMKEDYEGEKAERWRMYYENFLKLLRKKYPMAQIVCITTLLQHDDSWDRAIGEVVERLADPKISQCLFKRNGSATPGHLRISEAEEMSDELTTYIESLAIEGWE